jgi:hypothetical protein
VVRLAGDEPFGFVYISAVSSLLFPSLMIVYLAARNPLGVPSASM